MGMREVVGGSSGEAGRCVDAEARGAWVRACTAAARYATWMRTGVRASDKGTHQRATQPVSGRGSRGVGGG